MKKKVKKPVKKSARSKRTVGKVIEVNVSDAERRVIAYLLAEKDNFQNSPEHYWLMAEKN
jgi:hypothetical protein